MADLKKPKPVAKHLQRRKFIGRARSTKDLLARIKAEQEKRKNKKGK